MCVCSHGLPESAIRQEKSEMIAFFCGQMSQSPKSLSLLPSLDLVKKGNLSEW